MLWSPSKDFIEKSNLTQYCQWLAKTKRLDSKDYHALWSWSVTHVEEFWKSLWKYFNILHDGEFKSVIGDQPNFAVSWFEGTQLNYAEHIFRNATDQQPAIVFQNESGNLQEISWKDLLSQVGSIQKYLMERDVSLNDCVAAYLPCIPEATAGMLATVSLGAIWSSCSPDFGTEAVIDRFSQINPKILIASTQYSYGGKTFDKTGVIQELIKRLPTLRHIILVSDELPDNSQEKIVLWTNLLLDKKDRPHVVRVPFSHPLWVLYSSGTTGLPKAFVHSHGGILIEHLKYGAFHNDFKPGERCFWYTTTGWMMWNYIHGALLHGATMVLYDGSVAYPDLNILWKFIDRARINHFGTSAAYLLTNMKEGITPQRTCDLSTLRSISSTGSTLPQEGFEWVYQHVKKDVWLISMSGGSDVCSAFVGGNPTWPVYAGEIQCRALGCNLKAYNDEGSSVQNEVGEMVIETPMPSMPIYFWNDPDFTRYSESYFQTFPNVWRHGDWIKITDHLGVVIYGRSDATLNRGGVRIGTSEIYRAIDKVPEIKDSLIICVEQKNGAFWMPLFVVMKEGMSLTDEIKQKLNKTLRADYSPRHVPDEIIGVPDIPYTISGKKTETPVKKVLMGIDPQKVMSSGTLRNPASMDTFIKLASKRIP